MKQTWNKIQETLKDLHQCLESDKLEKIYVSVAIEIIDEIAEVCLKEIKEI